MNTIYAFLERVPRLCLWAVIGYYILKGLIHG
jgi:hypothetical protein